MDNREQIIAAAKEVGFGDYAHEALTMFERFYDIAVNAGYQKASDRIKQLEAEQDELRLIIALYDKAMTASWPEGARGEAFDHWNAARIALGATPAQSLAHILADAARYQWFTKYLVGSRTDLDDTFVAATTKADLDAAIDAAIRVELPDWP